MKPLTRKWCGDDNKLKYSSYNSDGCHTSAVFQRLIELPVIKVSGSFSETSQARLTKDHVKACFGALAVLREIGHLLTNGYLKLILLFGLMFAFPWFRYIGGNRPHLWSLKYVSPGVYIMDLMYTALFPTDYVASLLFFYYYIL